MQLISFKLEQTFNELVSGVCFVGADNEEGEKGKKNFS